ncbi:MAG TPA: 30S ribosomal protein S10, partial [Chromatiaceae bacterium]|nr:30S ribosomal protein S10 [Chromatiaceae bacterium]
MPTRAVIKLVSTNLESLQSVVDDLLEIAKKTGVKVKGPIPLPRRRIIVPTRKTPCGEGSKTWDKWEL